MATWKIDPAHTDVLFSAKHLMVTTVRGTFSDVDGTLELDEQVPENSRGEVRIAVESISTGNAQRDGHLKSGDFFLGEEHPHIVARATKVERKGDHYQVTVDVTVRGVTRPVVFDAEFGGIVQGLNGRHFGATLTAKIDRREWNVNWNMPVGDALLVGNDIKLEIEIAADEVAVPAEAGAANA